MPLGADKFYRKKWTVEKMLYNVCMAFQISKIAGSNTQTPVLREL